MQLRLKPLSIVGSWMLLGLGSDLAAQTATDQLSEEVVVTGYRQSLANAAEVKRESVNITDSVFAEDIGKFPDLNIAEALNRVPGIQLTREVDGSGVNIAVRGLNTNFTKIILNGAQVAVASSGRTDAQNGNREVDLDVFPTEFFTRLDVNKTSTASLIEGGVAGTVNMRTARPFDSDAGYLTYQLQLGYDELGEDISPRAALIGSWLSEDDRFGVLAGVSVVNNKVTTRGFETFGWTNPNLTYEQCGRAAPEGAYPGTPAPDCNTGGDGFVIGQPVNVDPAGNPISVPGYHVLPAGATITGSSGAVYGPGTRITDEFLLDVNPGVSLSRLSEALIPRIGRPHYSEGDRDRYAVTTSLEFRPSEAQQYYLDLLYARAERNFNRLDMMLVGRNSQLIPTNLELDGNDVVTSADFYNAQFFLEARPYDEELDFYNINPGARFEFSDTLRLDAQLNASKSDWFREAPTVGVVSNLDAGVVANYRNQGGDIPSFGASIDLNDPNQPAGWTWERAFVSNEERETETLGLHIDFRYGDDANNITLGLAYDEAQRSILGLDNTEAWENYVCRGGVQDPDPRPPCRGVAGSAIPEDELADYLIPGPAGFISVDYDALFAATNYREFSRDAPPANGTATGARSGDIDESTVGLYVELNGETEVAGRALRTNAGLRFITTDQTVAGPVSFGDDFQIQELDSTYKELLPSFNTSFNLTDDIVLRLAGSRSLTRANPSDMLPATNFSDPSAQTANQGNPELAPYLSTNLDIGAEWYTGNEGYVALNYFHKQITGFTVAGSRLIPYSQLGVPWDALSEPQREAINQRGGPDQALVDVQTQVNADGVLNLTGLELIWVQPLDRFVEGLGFSLNYFANRQQPRGSGVPPIATGISRSTYNFTAYYERGDFSIRLSRVWNDEQYGSGIGQNGIADAQRFIEARGQWDMSATYSLPDLPTAPTLTFNLINFGSDPQREIFSYGNAPYLYYDPGYSAIIGIRGNVF